MSISLKERFSQFVRVPMPQLEADPITVLRKLIRVLESNFRNIESAIANLKRDLKYGETQYINLPIGSYFPGVPGYLDSSGEVSSAFASTPSTCHGFLVYGDTALDPTSDNADFAIRGVVEATITGAIGAELYLSTGGGLTATAPSGSGECVRKVGDKLADNYVWWDPSPEYTDIP